MSTLRIDEIINQYCGTKDNVSNYNEKNGKFIIVIKNRSLVDIDSLTKIFGDSNVELAGNHLKIKNGNLVEREEDKMAKIDYAAVSTSIVELVGGPENVEVFTHCFTRLRFVVKDKNVVKDTEIQKLPGVLGTIYGSGQFQVILGENLFPVYDYIEKNYDLAEAEAVNENHKEDYKMGNGNKGIKGIFMTCIQFMSSSVAPFITALFGAGTLKVILSISSMIWPAITANQTYQLFNTFSNVPFYFMPILIAYGAARTLKANPIFAIILACSLIHPDWAKLVSAGDPVAIFGLPVKLVTYSSTLLPAVFGAILVAYLERFFYKRIPAVLRSVLAPLCILVIAYPVTILVLGPIGNVLGTVIFKTFTTIQQYTGGFATGILTAIFPFLIMTGTNMLVIHPMTEVLNNLGYDSIFSPCLVCHNMAEGGAALAVAVKTKNKQLKGDAVSAGIGAIISGISEPCVYGINLRLKKPTIGVCAGGFVGGTVAAFLGAKAFAFGRYSIFCIPVFEKTALAIIIGMTAAVVVSFVVTYVLGFEDPAE